MPGTIDWGSTDAGGDWSVQLIIEISRFLLDC